jgi:two-component sensor histidine kinase
VNGTLDISCSVHDDAVTVIWTERGGPLVAQPSTQDGFGSKLVHRTMASQLDGGISFNWSPDGLVATLRMSKTRLSR